MHLLPALPPGLPNGSVRGLLARGGFEVDVTWAGGVLTEAVLRVRTSGPARLRTARAVTVTTSTGVQVPARVRSPVSRPSPRRGARTIESAPRIRPSHLLPRAAHGSRCTSGPAGSPRPRYCWYDSTSSIGRARASAGSSPASTRARRWRSRSQH
ncbi:glycoside hydrolase family 95-like protein [Streptomyces sp. NBC_00467]|uniref:glycoside hydrolase family 95-like protein n=1 Tax=Streptomyces sp. NBC_00467 TaxID=2975752 RepID=UPI003FA77170